MRKNFTISFITLILIITLSSFSGWISSFVPPQGHTGANGSYCTSCHSGNALNNAGGSVIVTGLPDAGYVAGTAYSFTLSTTHTTADRRRWGFSIEARNSLNQKVGTFTTTNSNAGINGDELSHRSAVSTTSQASYTYNNLTWTAPVNPAAADETITFYFVGNAANGAGGNSGDYIYSGTKTITRQAVSTTYTFTGNGIWMDAANWSNSQVPPATIVGQATIIINPIADGECILNEEKHFGSNVTLIINPGKKFRVNGNLIIN